MTKSVPHPRWTTARLEMTLAERYGPSARGGVDTAAVADAFGVTQRTVQRWLSGPRRRRPLLPQRRFEQLAHELAPQPLHSQRRTQNHEYAIEAIRRIDRDPGAVLPAWEAQGWLGEHVVAIIAIHDSRVRRVVFGRADSTEFDSRHRRSGWAVASVVVPTRFHALLIVDAVLEQVDPWRIRAWDGPTISWLDDAPIVNLTAIEADVLREVDPNG